MGQAVNMPYNHGYDIRRLSNIPSHMQSLLFKCGDSLISASKRTANVFPNMWVALRRSVTLPVPVASAKRTIKLIKTYFWSTMA